MKNWLSLSIAAAIVVSVSSAPVSAQGRSLTLSNVHMCCPMCEKAIMGAIEKVENVSCVVDRDKRSVTLTLSDDGRARDGLAAVEAIAAAGFYGESSRARAKMKDESKGLSGKVDSLTLTGIHNCCGQCVTAIKEVVGKVEGAETPDVASKSREFTVTGNFEGAKLIQELNKAGFYVKVKK